MWSIEYAEMCLSICLYGFWEFWFYDIRENDRMVSTAWIQTYVLVTDARSCICMRPYMCVCARVCVCVCVCMCVWVSVCVCVIIFSLITWLKTIHDLLVLLIAPRAFSCMQMILKYKQAVKFSEDPRSGLLTHTHTNTHMNGRTNKNHRSFIEIIRYAVI